MGNGKFGWTDEHGSEIVWQTVGTFAEGRVWYASGKVKAGIASAGDSRAERGGREAQEADREGRRRALRADDRGLHAQRYAGPPISILRVLGPTVPNVAEQAAGQLLDFFGGIAAYVQKHPTKADELLGAAEEVNSLRIIATD